ncbi:MAG: YbaB/EbfC family nucleoid-associated protein [Clostridiales bacterium]|nr:YbaB/EbfC family nucleoid-associated protein [Clostridiales bacterium]
MAKPRRGGFGGPAMGGANMQQLMAQAQRMQAQMEEKKNELDSREFSAAAGGGVVKATVTGAKQLTALEIDPEVVDPEDIEMLCDLVIAAVNEALNTADATVSEEMSKISGGLGLGL